MIVTHRGQIVILMIVRRVGQIAFLMIVTHVGHNLISQSCFICKMRGEKYLLDLSPVEEKIFKICK